MEVNAMTLTLVQVQWIERCARQLMRLGPLFTYVEAVNLAFDLYRAWPGMAPTAAAKAFMAPEQLAA